MFQDNPDDQRRPWTQDGWNGVGTQDGWRRVGTQVGVTGGTRRKWYSLECERRRVDTYEERDYKHTKQESRGNPEIEESLE